MYKCKYCNKEFTPNYQVKKRYIMSFCSKSCKSKYEILNNKNTVVKIKYHNKTHLEKDIKKIIISNNKYMGYSEICKILSIPKKTLSKFRISVLTLNLECGFKKSKSVFKDYVYSFLITKFKIVVREKTFESCLSKKGHNLRFDFYIPEYNILIEADGVQHNDEKNPFFNENNIENDNIKDTWCIKNNIKLIRIPYKRNIDDDYLQKYINV
jgi:hypothetical protein